jgi:hypothetical protein
MPVERGWKARLHYRTDQFLSSGPGKQLLLLFVLTLGVVLLHLAVALILSLPVGDSVGEKFWFYFTRILDTGAMGDDEGWAVRAVSAVDTVMGLVVAGLLISALAGNFQERLDSIKRGGSPVMEKDHFLILGWSDKIYSVIDQLSEANQEKGRSITVVVMAEREKLEMEEKLRLKVQHLKPSSWWCAPARRCRSPIWRAWPSIARRRSSCSSTKTTRKIRIAPMAASSRRCWRSTTTPTGSTPTRSA